MKARIKIKSRTKVKKVTLQRKRLYYINPIVRWWLIAMGKRDSKKHQNIATVHPFVDYEKAKIEKYVSKIMCIFNRKTMPIFAYYDKTLTMLEQQIYIVNNLIERLKDSHYPEEIVIVKNQGAIDKFDDMLDVKRDSENSLDNTAIRLRRFKEYQQNLSPVRKELYNEMQKLLIIYQELCVYAANIEGIRSQAEMLVKQYVSYINMRISLYKKGWLANNKVKVPELISQDSFNLPESKRKIYVDDKINEIIKDYGKIMNP